MVNQHGNDLGVTFLSSFNDLGMKEMMLEWLFFILGWWLNDWNEGGMKKFLMKDKCPWFFFSIFPFLIVPYLIIWHSFNVWNEHGIVFNHSTLSFLIFSPILLDVDGNWWWNDLNDVAMRIFLMEKILITLIPWSSLSFWDIGKWFFVIRWSFLYWMTLEWRRWCWNDFFSSWDDGWMTEMRVEWGNFWRKANALDFSLYHSILILTIFIIWHSFNVWNEHGMVFNHSTLSSVLFWCHPIILVSFHHSEFISMPFTNFVVFLLFHTPSHVIPSFWYHSSHSIVIPLSFKTFYSHSVIPTSFAIIQWALHAPAPKSRHFSCNQPLG